MTETKDSQSPLNFTLMHGIYLSLISILLTLIIWSGKMDENFGIFASFFVHIANLIIILLYLTYSTRLYRDRIYNGEIRYGKAFSYGVLVFLCSSVISGFFSFILNRYIDPTYLQRVVEAYREHLYQWMTKYNTPQEQIDQTLALLKAGKMSTPLETLQQSFVSGVFGGAILSLFSAALVKKKSKIVVSSRTDNIEN